MDKCKTVQNKMNEITIKPEIEKQLELKQSMVDESIINSFGCDNCEWRYSNKCHIFAANSTNYPGKPCKQRLLWLFAYMPNYEKMPTHDQFMHDFGKYRNLSMMMKDNKELDEEQARYENFIKQWEDEPDKAENPHYYIPLNNHQRELRRLRSQWQEAMSQHLKYTDSQLNRDAKEKIETKKLMTPSDITRLMFEARKRVNGEVIDVEDNK